QAERAGDPRRWTLGGNEVDRQSFLRPQDDFERSAPARCAANAETALDRRRPVAHIPQPLPSCGHVGREAFAVVLDRDEPLPGGTLADDDLCGSRVSVAADIAQPFLDDAEDLDLLVWCETDCRVDL